MNTVQGLIKEIKHIKVLAEEKRNKWQFPNEAWIEANASVKVCEHLLDLQALEHITKCENCKTLEQNLKDAVSAGFDNVSELTKECFDLKRKLEHIQQPSMKWVKCSDRLPEKDKRVFWRLKDSYDDYDTGYAHFNNTKHIKENIQWLDEQPTHTEDIHL